MRKTRSRRDNRASLADLIATHKEDIVRRWTAVVSERLGGPKVDRADLQDGLEDYLVGISLALRRDSGVLVDQGSELWQKIAQEHAITRVNLGFDIAHLFEEFVILRRILFDVAREKQRLSGEGGVDIAELITAAVRVAIRNYMEARDYATRRAEAEHVAFITHELRNPLTTALIAASELTGPPEEARRREILLRNLHRIEELIEHVLVTERGEAGEIQAHLDDITLRVALEEPAEAGRAKAEAKGLQWVADFNPVLRLYGDPLLLGSAVHNLIENAVKFTDSGTVELCAERHREDLIIHVRDTGPGVPQDELEAIFEPFRRGSSKKRGTGMGLPIARRAVEAQGGTLQVESTAGKGSHFWISLPGRARDGTHTRSE